MHKILHHPNGSTRKIHLGGWKKQHVDERDEHFKIKLHGSLFAIPPSVDLRPSCSPVEDQGELGSCTANMFAGIIEYNEIKRSGAADPEVTGGGAKVTVSNVAVAGDGSITFSSKVVPPSAPAPTPTPGPTPTPTPGPTPAPKKLIDVSRLFEYYGTRKIEGTVTEDSGATIRDAIKCGVTYGVADELTWPYDISKFTINPPQTVWTTAASHKVTSYHAITDGDLQTMKSVLASGFPIGFGFQVYDYMMSADMAKKGFLPVPGPNEQLQGGHAVCLVGYDDTKQAFLVRNSWGTDWALQGYFWMAYAYVGNTRLASDFWVVQSSPV